MLKYSSQRSGLRPGVPRAVGDRSLALSSLHAATLLLARLGFLLLVNCYCFRYVQPRISLPRFVLSFTTLLLIDLLVT